MLECGRVVRMMPRPAATQLGQVGSAAVSLEEGRADAARLSGLTGNDHGGGRGISEESRTLRLGRVERARRDLARHDESAAASSRGDEMRDRLQRHEEAQTGRIHVKAETRTFGQTELALDERSGAGNGLLRGSRGSDDQIDR